jgi:hypothetical protein
MKALELTEEHKVKLLEMCKRLFPEHNYLEIRDSTEDFNYPFEHVCIEIDRSIDDLKIIHWFEFCHTYLARKIFNSGEVFDDPVSDSSDGLANMMFEQEWINSYHPVDHLYEQFKKLK